jgi:hypothetical protein
MNHLRRSINPQGKIKPIGDPKLRERLPLAAGRTTALQRLLLRKKLLESHAREVD